MTSGTEGWASYQEVASVLVGDRPVAAATPIPPLKLTIVFLITLNESFTENIVWPFLPFMVKDFGYADDDVGYYVGTLVSSYFVAQLSSSLPWGKLSDVYGRRRTLLTGLMGTTGAILAFGFAPTFQLALVARIISGLLNGNIGITKTYICEMTDSTNRAQAYTVITIGWGVGGIAAPALGGLLSNPARNLPWLVGPSGLFAVYPYLLPCLFNASFGLSAFTLACFFLPETDRFKALQHRRAVKKLGRGPYAAVDASPLNASPPLTLRVSSSSTSLASSAASLFKSSFSPLRSRGGSSDEDTGAPYSSDLETPPSASCDGSSARTPLSAASPSLSPGSSSPSAHPGVLLPKSQSAVDSHRARHEATSSIFHAPSPCCALPSPTSPPNRPHSPKAQTDGLSSENRVPRLPIEDDEDAPSLSTWQVIKQRDVLVSTLCYGLLCLTWVLFDETFAVFCEASVKEGGLAFSESQIGSLLAITGCSSIFFQVFCYHRYCKRFGSVGGYKLLLYLGAPFFLLFPLTNTVAERESRTVLWIVLAVFMVYRGIVSGSVYNGVCLAVNNSLSSEYSGVVNGFAQCLGALGRAIGPVTGGAVWSVSVGSSAAGHNYYLFLLATSLLVLTALVSRHLRPELDLPYEERQTRTPVVQWPAVELTCTSPPPAACDTVLTVST